METKKNNLAVALVHYPVYNKHKEIVTTSLTNLDQHDIARSCRTFGVDRFYIVMPSQGQIELAQKISSHWSQGVGADYNPDRKEALSKVEIVKSIEEAKDHYSKLLNKEVKIVVTGALKRDNSITVSKFKGLLSEGTSFMLMFGTGWGLTDEVFDAADYVLEPIIGSTDYNHLSVRSAVAIYLDRIRN